MLTIAWCEAEVQYRHNLAQLRCNATAHMQAQLWTLLGAGLQSPCHPTPSVLRHSQTTSDGLPSIAALSSSADDTQEVRLVAKFCLPGYRADPRLPSFDALTQVEALIMEAASYRRMSSRRGTVTPRFYGPWRGECTDCEYISVKYDACLMLLEDCGGSLGQVESTLPSNM